MKIQLTGKMRGKLVVLEGLDKAGKSTQCVKLVENLQHIGHNVLHLQFPGKSTSPHNKG